VFEAYPTHQTFVQPTGDQSLMGDGGEQDVRGKISMKELFGRRNIKKDGTEGKVSCVQEVCGLGLCKTSAVLAASQPGLFCSCTSPHFSCVLTSRFAAGGAAAGARAAAGGGHPVLLDQLLRL
jgi:hypothetical protein